MTKKDTSKENISDEVARIVGYSDENKFLETEMSIIKDKKQHTVRIPSQYVELAKINSEKDKFLFILIPPKEKGDKFTIKAELKRG